MAIDPRLLASEELNNFIESQMDDFTKVLIKEMDTPIKRKNWLSMQEKIQMILRLMFEMFGVESTRKILDQYLKTEEEVNKFANELVKKMEIK